MYLELKHIYGLSVVLVEMCLRTLGCLDLMNTEVCVFRQSILCAIDIVNINHIIFYM